MKQNIENPSDRTWDNDLFYRSLTSDVPYVASKNLKNLRNLQNQHSPKQENEPILHRIYEGKSKPKSTEIRFSKFFSEIVLMKIPQYKMEFLMERTHFDTYLSLKYRFPEQVNFLAPYSNFNDFINWAWFSKFRRSDEIFHNIDYFFRKNS